MDQRLTGYDLTKCAAIVLVVFGHVWRGLQTDGMIGDDALFQRVDQMIYLFHMPVFFFLSGLFFSAALPPLGFLRSRVIVLLWPLLLWSIVDGLAKYLSGTPVEGAPLTLVQVFLPWSPTTGIFWFLWSLFFLSLLAYPLARLPRPLHLAGMMLLALAAVLGLIGAGPFDSLWPVFIHMPEFFAGIAVATLGARHRLLDRRLVWPGIALFLAGQGLLALGLPQSGRWWAEIALALATLGFVLWISNLRPPAALLQHLTRLGQLTLPIYLTHILFTAVTRIALAKAGVDSLGLHLVVGTALGIAGPVGLYLLAQRFDLTALLGFERAPRAAAAQPAKAPWAVR